MLSVMTVVAIPSLTSSQAVSRAPCRNGRVSSASTVTDFPASTAPRMTPRAVPKPAVASAPALQWVSTRAVVGQQRRTVPADGPAARDVLVVDAVGLAAQPRGQFLHALAGVRAGGEGLLHALDRPEEVHRRRPRRRQEIGQALELGDELPGAGGLGALGAQRQPHRRRHADRRRAANHHGRDGLGHVRAGLAAHVHFATRQLALVDHHNHRRHPRRSSGAWLHSRGSGLGLRDSGRHSAGPGARMLGAIAVR